MNLTLAGSSIWVTIAPVIVINIGVIISIFAFSFSSKRPAKPEYLKGRHESKFLNSFFREWWYWITNPIAKLLIKMRLDPNSITLIGTVISCISAIFFAFGLFGYGGWIMVLGATFDMFDGRVARLLGKSTRSGAYLDSVMDRVGEGVIFIGLAYFFRDSWMLIPVIVALIGSMLVSYTRARGEGVGVDCKKGTMQRPERAAYIGTSTILDPLAFALLSIFWQSPPPVLVMGAVLIIAVMSCVTTAQRIIYIMNELDTTDKDEEELSVPQFLTSIGTKEGRGKLMQQAKYGYDRSQAKKDLSIMILVDGANDAVFSDLIRKGELPNISRHIIEKGVHSKAVSTFPSTTGPAFTPLVTGCFAGTCDIPGARWMDRRVPLTKKITTKRFRDYFGWGSYAMDLDLSRDVKTMFEYSRKAVNILGMLDRGAGISRDPAFFRGPVLYYQAKKKDNIEAVERTAYRMFVSALKRNPDFVFYYYPSVDRYSHEYSSSHDTVLDAYRRLDGYVGKMVKELSDSKKLERTHFVLTGDHGHSDVDKHFDLDALLEKHFKTIQTPATYKEWIGSDAVNMISGNAMSNIYFKKDEWREGLMFEELERRGLVQELLDDQAIDIVLGRSAEGGVIASSMRGRARIKEEDGGKISYGVTGSDPFGYTAIPSVLDKESALRLTWESAYPDGILQSVQLFRSERCGDLVVTASEDHDLKDRSSDTLRSSAHGSLRAEHMFVPLCMNIPVQNKFARTADIFSTVADVLGIEPEHELDGASLI